MAETNANAGEGDGDVGTHVRGRELTAQSIFAAVIVAAIMGLSYPYMVLKLGFGPNVSVVSAFFGFVILSLDRGQELRPLAKQHRANGRHGGGANRFYVHRACGVRHVARVEDRFVSPNPTPEQTFVWLTTAGWLGVLLAVPMRRHFIVDEKLPFPDGMAAAETLKVLDPPRGAREDAILAWIQAIRAASSARHRLVVVGRIDAAARGRADIHPGRGRVDAGRLDAWAPPAPPSSSRAMGVGFSYSLFERRQRHDHRIARLVLAGVGGASGLDRGAVVVGAKRTSARPSDAHAGAFFRDVARHRHGDGGRHDDPGRALALAGGGVSRAWRRQRVARGISVELGA